MGMRVGGGGTVEVGVGGTGVGLGSGVAVGVGGTGVNVGVGVGVTGSSRFSEDAQPVAARRARAVSKTCMRRINFPGSFCLVGSRFDTFRDS